MSRIRTLLLAVAAVLALCACAASSASASTKQITIVEENNGLDSNPMATLEKLKAMGVTMVKYYVTWSYLLPANVADATSAPKGSGSPSYYLPDFGQLAQIDQDASKVGVKLGFLITSPVPRWAETSTRGCTAYAISQDVCNPSVPDFKVFTEALGEEFNGTVSGVPAVRWWSIWNEPNYGVNLGPEMIGSSDYAGADQYRNLLDAAWSGLKATGHTTPQDTIVFGDLAPRGISASTAGNSQGIKPVQFTASLYCVDLAGRRLTGATASENGCPSSASAFRNDNPALFDASGVADHPYGQGIPPTTRTGDCKVGTETFCVASRRYPADPLWTDLASISDLENGLYRDLKAYGSHKQYSIWSTEYGYWTSPPGQQPCHSATQDDCDLSAAKAEIYLNQAEYISYRYARIASFDQYQLYMPTTGAWTDGLVKPSGAPEPTYDAWEVPLWIPDSTLKRAGNITVWGGVKPATYYQSTEKAKPQVAIQFKGRSGGWKTIRTQSVPTGSSHPGSYFTTSLKVTQSGSIRLVYFFGKQSLTSRTQAITVR